MDTSGNHWASALAIALALAAPAAAASDQGWINSAALDGSFISSMPEHLSFEEAASPSGVDLPLAAAPGPGVAAVPEPTSTLLLLAGLGVMAFIGLRSRK